LPGAALAPLDPRRADLRRAILYLSGGIGLGLVVLVVGPQPAYASVGILPGLIGCGYLIASRLTGR
jgi:hypothetical protein